jgi:hypothetical protein
MATVTYWTGLQCLIHPDYLEERPMETSAFQDTGAWLTRCAAS